MISRILKHLLLFGLAERLLSQRPLSAKTRRSLPKPNVNGRVITGPALLRIMHGF
jgi:hypothetical protein